MKKDTVETPAKPTGTSTETPVQVWFLVTQNGAVIGEAHHSKGKRLKLAKPVAEECASQGLGVLDGVA